MGKILSLIGVTLILSACTVTVHQPPVYTGWHGQPGAVWYVHPRTYYNARYREIPYWRHRPYHRRHW